MSYTFNGISLKNGRNINMDSLLLTSRHINDKDALLTVVCDGVGGLADGAYASGMAVRKLNSWFSEITNTDCMGLRMRDVILDINNNIVSQSKLKNISTGSTLSALLIIGDNYYIAHIGDSRIYCYENGVLSLLTNDNVSITGKLTGCIGRTNNIVLQYFEGKANNKIFLLCTDGLYKRMNMDYMLKKIKKLNKRILRELVKSLANYVIEAGEQDNISLALVKIEN